MFDTVMNIVTIADLDQVSARFLDANAFRELQEEMADLDFAVYRSDYWTKDSLRRKTSSVSAIKKTLGEVAKEPAEKKLLHLFQIMSVTAPGITEGVEKFLKKVTFG